MQHFESNDTCPGCKTFKPQSHEDFVELFVADAQPSSAHKKSFLQPFFAKVSPNSTSLSLTDLCSGLMSSLDLQRQHVRLILKQFVKQTKIYSKSSGSIERERALMNEQCESYKREIFSLKTQYEQSLRDMDDKLKAREATIIEQEKQIQELKRTNDQIRRVGTTSSTQGSLPGRSRPIYQKPPSANPFNISTGRPGSFASRAPNSGPAAFLQRSSSNPVIARGVPVRPAHRPYSTTSGGSSHGSGQRRPVSVTHRYGSQNHINKRRRVQPASTNSHHKRMSPNTAFVLNQGPTVAPAGTFFR